MLTDPKRIDWLTYFCREEFGEEVDGWLPLLREILADVVRRKGATAGSLDGRGWRELKVLLVAWVDGLARILTLVEDTGVWPDGLLDAYIAMIFKADGDATPLGQRPLSVLPGVHHPSRNTNKQM